jgi:hypothetical protein
VLRLRVCARLLAASVALACAGATSIARAAPPAEAPREAASIVLLPTAIADADRARPAREGDGELARLAQSLDALLADTAQDLGLSVVPPPPGVTRLADGDLLDRARASRAPVLLVSLAAVSSTDVELRLALAVPSAARVSIRRDRVTRDELPVRAVVLLRDLAKGLRHAPEKPAPTAAPPPAATSLAGRITLMSHATVFGGLVGYSIQRGSGSDDPRLSIPLLLVGAGIGLGASFIASNEWDVSAADAWYFAAGAWWPTVAGHLIYQGRFSVTRSERDRWVFGLLGGGVGATIAALGLALRPMDDGGAIIAHSGGGLGLAFGALVEVAARGDAHHVPYAGMGYGAGLGWLAAAAIATQVRATQLRVALVDAGIAAGGLVGAGLASPLLLGDATPGKQRAWASIAAGSAVAGGLGAAILVHPRSTGKLTKTAWIPLVGVIGESSLGPLRAPVFGLGYAGSIEAIFPR